VFTIVVFAGSAFIGVQVLCMVVNIVVLEKIMQMRITQRVHFDVTKRGKEQVALFHRMQITWQEDWHGKDIGVIKNKI